LALAVAGLVIYGGLRVGTFLYVEDPLKSADAIFVLAGSRFERPLEAVDLYQAGHASVLVLSKQLAEPSFAILRARGILIPSDIETTVNVLARLGVDRKDILTTRVHDSTADEALTLRVMATNLDWKRVIVVTSKFHLRRAGFALRRQLEGTGVEVVMRGTRYDPAKPNRWWATRRDWRWILSEVPKLAAYLAGLGA
jgi:uncharacterized SAM-binding protein YcdF (DUF218 family)